MYTFMQYSLAVYLLTNPQIHTHIQNRFLFNYRLFYARSCVVSQLKAVLRHPISDANLCDSQVSKQC